MSDVLEQGATRWARPSDYGGPPPNWNGGGDRRRPSGLPEPKYPRNPAPAPGKRVPGVTPKWSPISPNPMRVPKLPKPLPTLPGGKGGLPIPAGRLPVPGGLGGGLGRIVPGIGIGLGLAGLLDDFLRPPQWYPVPNPANGWRLYGRCWLPPQAYLSSSELDGLNNACLGGQAFSTYTATPPAPPSDAATRWTLWCHPKPRGLGVYRRHVESWTRTLPAPNSEPKTVVRAVPMPYPMPDPNFARGLPSVRPGTHPLAGPAPDPAPEPEPEPVSDGAISGGTGRSIGADGVHPVRPRPRIPRLPREREAKATSRSKKILLALFKVLDEASELADLVDSLYEALPKETRDKWKCNRNLFGVDSAGQYGISNADCKAKALWHNWHKVDPEQAVENIIKNHIYDKVVGAMHRQLPRNTGGALDDAFQGFDKFFSDFLDNAIDF